MPNEMDLIGKAYELRAMHALPADIATSYLVAVIVGFNARAIDVAAEDLGFAITDRTPRQICATAVAMQRYFARNGEHMSVKIIPALGADPLTHDAIDLGEFTGDPASDSYRRLGELAAQFGYHGPLRPPGDGVTRVTLGQRPQGGAPELN